jgi:hypothetical protein
MVVVTTMEVAVAEDLQLGETLCNVVGFSVECHTL